MFRRRNEKPLEHAFQDALWPRMGWQRYFKYLSLRFYKMTLYKNGIAEGLALGASISFVPLPGTHLVQTFFMCMFFRFSFIASIIGSLVGNPLTFPFMWMASYSMGKIALSLFGYTDFFVMPEDMGFKEYWQALINNPVNLMFPLMFGGYILSILTYPIFLFIFKGLINRGRELRKIYKAKHKKKWAYKI